MKLTINKTKTCTYLYVSKSYRDNNGRCTSKNVEKLGTIELLKEKLNGEDPIKWAKNYVTELTKKEKEDSRKIMVELSPSTLLKKDVQNSYNGGYLFLQQIYSELGLDKICKDISKNYNFEYDLSDILSKLLYSRIMYPASKLATHEISKKYIEQPSFDSQHIYKALSVLAKENDFMQASVFKNSIKKLKRQTGVIYYDCTNYFFEIDKAENLKQFGVSKEHRPNPIVQMGLFMDTNGFPLAFCINPGNTNEQITMRPLEEKLQEKFKLSKFVVCSDAGLSSLENRKYNSNTERSFITTQSVKSLPAHLEKYSLDDEGWRIVGSNKTFKISELDEEKDFDKMYYKERWINENNFSQRLIVTYSIKYKKYMQAKRQRHIERAEAVIADGGKQLSSKRNNDYKRLINVEKCTKDGEIAELTQYSINQEKIDKEAKYDGFYAICTDLQDNVKKILEVNKWRWKIEDSFRIMKFDFKARPVYLQRDDRITAHFLTCFLSLLIYRILETKLNNKYSCEKIIDTLANMNYMNIKGEGFMPTYNRTNITDDLHNIAGFRTDTEIITKQKMKKIINLTKS